MRKMAISVFKTNALRVIDEVSKSHESIIITKRGKSMAELIPFRSLKKEPIPGKPATSFVDEKDIVSPLGAGSSFHWSCWEKYPGIPIL